MTATRRNLLVPFALCLNIGADAAIVRFAGEEFTTTPGAPTPLSVVIEYEAGDPTALFSFGVRVIPELPTAGSLSGISVAPELNHNSILGSGAVIALDVWGAKGSIDAFADPLEPYTGSLLATFVASFDTPGVYSLTIDFFNTLGPTEEIFVSGSGVPIDDAITFRGAVVHVVPEPPVLPIGGAALVLLLAGRRREQTMR